MLSLDVFLIPYLTAFNMFNDIILSNFYALCIANPISIIIGCFYTIIQAIGICRFICRIPTSLIAIRPTIIVSSGISSPIPNIGRYSYKQYRYNNNY